MVAVMQSLHSSHWPPSFEDEYLSGPPSLDTAPNSPEPLPSWEAPPPSCAFAELPRRPLVMEAFDAGAAPVDALRRLMAPAIPPATGMDPACLAGRAVLAAQMRQDGGWNHEAGDLAAQLVTRLPGWPRDHFLQVFSDRQFEPYGFAEGPGKTPVRLLLVGDHYQALRGPELSTEDVPRQGNCFFDALVLAAGPAIAQALAGATPGRPAEAIRENLARLVETDPGIAEWVDLAKLAQEPVLPLPLPSAPRRGRVRKLSAAAKANTTKEIFALRELQQRIQTLRMKRDDDRVPKFHDHATVAEVATAHDIPVRRLKDLVRPDGTLRLSGSALLQRFAHEQGNPLMAVTAAVLDDVRAWARLPDGSTRLLSDDAILEYCMPRAIPITYLRALINLDGTLSHRGHRLVHLEMLHRHPRGIGETQGGPGQGRHIFVPLTMARLEVARNALRAGATHDEAAAQQGISCNHLRALVTVSGELRIPALEKQRVERRDALGLPALHVRPEVLMRLLGPGKGPLSSVEVWDLACESDAPFGTLRSYVTKDRMLTRAGQRFLQAAGVAVPQMHMAGPDTQADGAGRWTP